MGGGKHYSSLFFVVYYFFTAVLRAASGGGFIVVFAVRVAAGGGLLPGDPVLEVVDIGPFAEGVSDTGAFTGADTTIGGLTPVVFPPTAGGIIGGALALRCGSTDSGTGCVGCDDTGWIGC